MPLDYGQTVPLVTTLEQLRERGESVTVWRCLRRDGEQTLTAALDNPDGEVFYRRQAARVDAEGEQHRTT
ncbi:hypothetical protein [Streptomyces prasinus]|uniref:hypothetical protein n=1 Tax=Streptomyces prasinus TaxID=67345 RepID=UPI00339DA871